MVFTMFYRIVHYKPQFHVNFTPELMCCNLELTVDKLKETMGLRHPDMVSKNRINQRL